MSRVRKAARWASHPCVGANVAAAVRKRIAQEATAGACLSGSNGSSRRVKARTDREDGGGLAGDVSTLDRGGAANLTRREGDPSGGDAGIGVMFHGCTVAIYCAAHRRLLRVDALGSMRAARLVEGPELPREWEWERFVVVDGGGGMVALVCCAQQRFARLDEQWTMNSAGHVGAGALPNTWARERFTLLIIGEGCYAL